MQINIKRGRLKINPAGFVQTSRLLPKTIFAAALWLMFAPVQTWAHNGVVGNYMKCTASVSSISGAGGNVLSFGTPTQGINLLEGQIPEVQATINYECKSFLKSTTHTRLCFNIDGGNNSPSQNTPRLLAHPKRPTNTLQFQLYKPDGTVWGSNAPNSNAKPYMTEMLVIGPDGTKSDQITLTAKLLNHQETAAPYADGSPYEAVFNGISASLNWNTTYWGQHPANCGTYYSSNDSFPFTVQAHASPVCEFISADDIDFGTHTAGSTDLKQSGNLTVRCTNGTPYTVGLIPSNGNQEGSGEMKSTNPANADKVPYRLKKGTHTNAHLWGNNPSGSGSALKSTGDGNSQIHTISAEVKNTDYTPGEYKDKVTVDIRY